MHRIPHLVALALLGGCFHTTHRPSCAIETEPIGDDEEVGGVTAAELMAVVEGTHEVEGTYEEDEPVGVTVEVTRAGEAEYVHSTPTTVVTRSFGVGSSQLMMMVHCQDHVRVPVNMRVTTDDGAVDVAVAAYTAAEDWGGSEPVQAAIRGDAALDDVTLPFVEDPADYEETYAFAHAGFPLDGEPPSGTAGWGGTQRTEETVSSSASYVVRW